MMLERNVVTDDDVHLTALIIEDDDNVYVNEDYDDNDNHTDYDYVDNHNLVCLFHKDNAL